MLVKTLVLKTPLILLGITLESQSSLHGTRVIVAHPILRGKGLNRSLYLAPPLVLSPPLITNGRSKKRKRFGNAWLDGGMMHTHVENVEDLESDDYVV
jgi:hypothetical protein